MMRRPFSSRKAIAVASVSAGTVSTACVLITFMPTGLLIAALRRPSKPGNAPSGVSELNGDLDHTLGLIAIDRDPGAIRPPVGHGDEHLREHVAQLPGAVLPFSGTAIRCHTLLSPICFGLYAVTN